MHSGQVGLASAVACTSYWACLAEMSGRELSLGRKTWLHCRVPRGGLLSVAEMSDWISSALSQGLEMGLSRVRKRRRVGTRRARETGKVAAGRSIRPPLAATGPARSPC
jgi:hypothetical protein